MGGVWSPELHDCAFPLVSRNGARGVTFGGMAQTTDTLTAILWSLGEACSAGRTADTIILDEATRESIQRAGFGYWSAGPATWSLFNVPVVTGDVQGWRLQLSYGRAAAA